MAVEQPSLWDRRPEPDTPSEADAPVAPAPAARLAPRILRVTDLNRRVRSLIDADGMLADVFVEGEVSQPSFPPSGHCFFTLKDAVSQIRAVCFREQLERATIRPAHGMNVICRGRVRGYEPQGTYQLYVDTITPAGEGDLHARYEALRIKLAAAGLFEESRKRPIPRWPRRIGVVTSPVGAVWRDITNVLRRRYPLCEIVLSPTVVQGDTAAPAIVRALRRLYAQPDLDTIILARGGGSLEDLWSFNDEKVVRTVAESPVPIVVGVGHESDVTLADFAADLRAPTPSAAAELATPDATQMATILNRLRDRASAALLGWATQRRRLLDGEKRALAGLSPDIAGARQRAADLVDRAGRATEDRLRNRRMLLNGAADALRTLSPAATLERGYAIARTDDGRIVRDVGAVRRDDRLEVIVARGRIDTRVEKATAADAEELLS